MARTVDEAFFHTKKRDRKFYFTTSFELKNGTPDKTWSNFFILMSGLPNLRHGSILFYNMEA